MGCSCLSLFCRGAYRSAAANKLCPGSCGHQVAIAMLVGIQVVIQQVAAISQQLTELHDSLAQAIGKLRVSIALLRAMVDAANELWGNAEFLLDKLHDDAASTLRSSPSAVSMHICIKMSNVAPSVCRLM